MRNLDGMFEFVPSLMGTMSVINATAIGAPVDVRGFRQVLAILAADGVVGSNTDYLSVKIQEGNSIAGTGALWTDITDGAYQAGSFDFDQLTFAGTSPVMQMQKQYERLDDTNRKRYIRAHATITGTAGVGIRVFCGFLLGSPQDSSYITNAVTQATGNIQFYWGA